MKISVITLVLLASQSHALDFGLGKMLPKGRSSAVDCVNLSGTWKGVCVGLQDEKIGETVIKQEGCSLITIDGVTHFPGGNQVQTVTGPVEEGVPTFFANVVTKSEWNSSRDGLLLNMTGLIDVGPSEDINFYFKGKMALEAEKLVISGQFHTADINEKFHCSYDRVN